MFIIFKRDIMGSKPSLFISILIIFLISYQEAQANSKYKTDQLFGSIKFSQSMLASGNELSNPIEFYAIQRSENKNLMYNSFFEGKNQKKDFKTNKDSKRLKWLGLGAFWWAAFFDHYQDAISDRGGKKEYIFGADTDQWHLAKNLAHLGYLTSAFAVGMEMERGNLKFRRLAYRTAGSVLIYWFIQVIVYDKARYDVWFDYNNDYREHGPIIFDLKGRDHRIKFAPWARPFVDLIRVGGGMYLVIKF